MPFQQSHNRQVLVDLNAVAANYRILKDRSGPAECAAVLKANAYGLGMAQIARRLAAEGCRVYFVATQDEGASLRAAVPDAHIYVLEGPEEGRQGLATEARLWPVLNDFEQWRSWTRTLVAGDENHCIVHIDTGMNRLGFDEHDLQKLAADNESLARVRIDFVMTHLACADESEHARNNEQLERFDRLRALLPNCRTSVAESSGVFLDSRYAGDMVRVGIGLYGARPRRDMPNPMHEAVRLGGRIIQLRDIPIDDEVGYGATARVAANSRLATVSIGYADGYPRCLGNRGEAIVAGQRVPLVGRVSMDTLVVDVSRLSRDAVQVGDWATLIGGDLDIDTVAHLAGTISYELLARIGARVRRVYV